MSPTKQIDFPDGRLRYPEEILQRRQSLIESGKEALKIGNLREQLVVAADIFRLLGDQMSVEVAAQTKAIMVVMRDRMKRGTI